MQDITIYALVDPRTDEVRYIGKTTDFVRRLRRHRTEQGRTPRHYWLASLRAQGLEPQGIVLEVVQESQWDEREQHWIRHYREQGARLTNLATGGRGAVGIIPSEATRRKLSESGKRAWQEKPRSLTDEHKAKLATLHKGRKRRDETKARISEAMKGRHLTDEHRAKMSAARAGVPHAPPSDETRRKIGAALSGERNGQSKLDWEKVREIRRRYAEGGISLSALGREYGVDTKQIHRVVRNEAWRESE